MYLSFKCLLTLDLMNRATFEFQSLFENTER